MNPGPLLVSLTAVLEPLELVIQTVTGEVTTTCLTQGFLTTATW